MAYYATNKLLDAHVKVWQVELDDYWDYEVFVASPFKDRGGYRYNQDCFKSRKGAITAALKHLKKEFKDNNLEVTITYKEWIGKDYEITND